MSASPLLGVTEFFRPGEHERVERVLDELRALGIEHIRTLVSWADWHADGGRRWYAWLLPRLAREMDVLASVFYTPPSIAVEPRAAAPPRRPRDYADFLDVLLDEHGRHFEWVGLWNEPNNLNNWDWRLDPGWEAFAEMIGAAGHWVRKRGHRALLGGMCPTDPNWLGLMAARGVLAHVDAVAIHGFPGTWEYDWSDWNVPLGKVRQALAAHGVDRPVWITEAGFSTWRHDEFRQAHEFLRLASAPVDRVYWYAAEDLDHDLPTEDGHHTDERHYHMGLHRADGSRKLLARLWAAGGVDEVRRTATVCPPFRASRSSPAAEAERQREQEPDHGRGRTRARASDGRDEPADELLRSNGRPAARERVLVTGGAGFVGTNLVDRLVRDGRQVVVLDNLSRPGVERNLRWLTERHGPRVEPMIVDVRDRWAVGAAVARADRVFHFAGQAAVTSSLADPRSDFEVNAAGTLNLLEAVRRRSDPPPLVFTSTNKVYGALGHLSLVRRGSRYEPCDESVRASGIDESRPVDFHSPYGCSKGAADLYVLDYARTYSLPAVVLRMSCIYGPHQHGSEDQGWVAHFLIRAIRGEAIRIYGTGLQVRDVLFVDDLVEALLGTSRRARELAGRAFNVGGGPRNTTSLLDLVHLIEEIRGASPMVTFDGWRPGDQRYYVSDTAALRRAVDWRPRTGVREGVRRLHDWLAPRHRDGRGRAGGARRRRVTPTGRPSTIAPPAPGGAG